VSRIIANEGALVAHGMADVRALALRVAAAGVAACDPERAAASAVVLADTSLRVGDVELPLADVDRIVLLGAGKASAGIARAMERALGDRLAGGAVAVRAGEQVDLERIEVLISDHPLPTARSVAAGSRLLAWAAELGPHDLVLACFTGGSSALAVQPIGDVTLEDKRALTRLLLGSGLGITTTNLVRRHVSALKGGRLAQAIAPARVVNLTVSDVAGDPLDAITDPTVSDASTPDEAVAALRENGLWPRVPGSIREHLGGSAGPPPAIDEPATVVLASGRTACDAMVAEARTLGAKATVRSTSLEGESREVGRLLAGLARESADSGSPFPPPHVVVGAGGESTVTLAANQRFGAGGPNQEATIAAALELESHHRVAVVFMDSDGSDGGTRFAGGVTDGLTRARARARGVDLRAALRGHASTAALERLGDGICTGPTYTNVNDLFVIVIMDAEPTAP
jgi:glycerate-2-kinase